MTCGVDIGSKRGKPRPVIEYKKVKIYRRRLKDGRLQTAIVVTGDTVKRVTVNDTESEG